MNENDTGPDKENTDAIYSIWITFSLQKETNNIVFFFFLRLNIIHISIGPKI